MSDPDLLQKFEEATRLSAAGMFLSVLMGIARTILTADRRTIIGLARGAFLAGITAVLIANLLDGYSINGGLKIFIVAMCGFCADDLLQGVLKISGAMRDDPLGTVGKLLDICKRK